VPPHCPAALALGLALRELLPGLKQLSRQKSLTAFPDVCNPINMKKEN